MSTDIEKYLKVFSIAKRYFTRTHPRFLAGIGQGLTLREGETPKLVWSPVAAMAAILHTQRPLFSKWVLQMLIVFAGAQS